MILEHWLKKNRRSSNKFADEIGLSRSLIYKIIRGHRGCSARTATIIEKATNGEVTRLECLFPEEFLEKRENKTIVQRTTAKSLFSE